MTYDRRGKDRRAGGERPQEAARSEVENATLARYVADIAARLRVACAHLSTEEFDQLVADIALMRLRFDEIDAKPGSHRPIRDPKGPR
jgi:hypothetical protein